MLPRCSLVLITLIHIKISAASLLTTLSSRVQLWCDTPEISVILMKTAGTTGNGGGACVLARETAYRGVGVIRSGMWLCEMAD